MVFRFALPFLALSLAATASQGMSRLSELRCDDSTRLEMSLTRALGAEKQGVGIRDPETLLEVWINRSNGDWTIVQSYSNGTSCIVAVGEHWQGELLVQDPA